MNNGFIQTGVSDDGTFGVGGNTSPGILYDTTGAGNYLSTADWLTPGTAQEVFYVSYTEGGASANNNDSFGSPGMPTLISGDANQVIAISTWGDLSITQVYTLAPGSKILDVNITILNTSGTNTATNVQYARSIDPDVDSNGLPGSTSSTNNTQGIGATATSEVVLATGPVSGNILGMLIHDSVGVTHNTGVSASWNADANYYLSGTNNGDGDNTIGVGFQVASLAPNTSTTFNFSYVFADSVNDFIAVSALDNAPTVEDRIPYQEAHEYVNFNYTIPVGTFTDVDGDNTLSYSATLVDVDPETGVYLALPSWLTINATTGQFSGIPEYDRNSGDNLYQVRVVATDNYGLMVEDSFQLAVEPEINDAPVATGLHNLSFNEDAANSATFEPTSIMGSIVTPFTDPDPGAVLNYSATLADGSALPTWLHFSVDYGSDTHSFADDRLIFTGTPRNSNVGSLDITITADDGLGGRDNGSVGSGTFTLTVNNTNDKPFLAHTIPDAPTSGTVIWENDPYSYTVPANTFGDVDLGDSLNYSASSANGNALPSWLHFDPASRTFTGTPPVGIYNLRVTATDVGHASTYDIFKLTVTDVNNEPTGSATATLSAGTEDVAYTVNESDLLTGFSDADVGDVLGVIDLTADHGTVTDNGDGTFTIAPDANYNGMVTLNYLVQDYLSDGVTAKTDRFGQVDPNGPVTATQHFSLAATQDPVVVSATDVIGAVTEDNGMDVTNAITSGTDTGVLTFTDFDSADVHLVSSTGTAIGAVIGSLAVIKDSDSTTNPVSDPSTATGQLMWAYTVAGNAADSLAQGETKVDSFSITVDDQNGNVVTKQIDVTVTGTNDSPTGSASATLTAGTEDVDYVVNEADLLTGFSDVDNLANLSVVNLSADHGTVSPIDGAGNVTITPEANYSGAVTLSYTVMDEHNASVSATQAFTLAAVEDAPTADATLMLGTVTEDGGSDVSGAAMSSAATGTLLFYDVDAVDTHSISSVAITSTPAATPIGTLSTNLDADTTGTQDPNATEGQLSWAYSLAAGAADYLAVGETQIDKFTITIDDAQVGGAITREVNVTVTGVNDTPVDTTPTATLADGTEDTSSYTFSDTDLLAGFNDVDTTDSLSVVSTPSADYGVVSVASTDADGTNHYVFVADSNYNGTVTLSYAVTDGQVVTPVSASRSFTLTPVEDTPVVTSSLTTQSATAGVLFSYDIEGADPIAITDYDIDHAIAGDSGLFPDDVIHYVDQTTLPTTQESLTFSLTSNTHNLVGGVDVFDALPTGYWLSINSVTGLLSGTPSETDVANVSAAGGFVTVRVVATDMAGAAVSTYVNINLSYNSLDGTTGNDTLTGTSAKDVINGYAGADSLTGLASDDTLVGGGDNDTLVGGTGNDSLDGGGGDDTFNGDQSGNDTISGGTGTDTLDYSASIDTISVNLTNTTSAQFVGTSSGTDKISGIENVIGSQAANTLTGDASANSLSGNGGADSLNGGLGNDSLNGGTGNDTLIGGAGNDTIVGASGIDTLSYTGSTDVINVNLTTGTSTGTTTNSAGNSGNDVISGIENVIGSAGANTLVGDANANSLNGDAGNDNLSGGAGNDILNGGTGNDTLVGGLDNDSLTGGDGNDTFNGSQVGNDTIIGGTGSDTLDYSTATGAASEDISVNLTTSQAFSSVAGGIGTDTISGIETVIGSIGNNLLTGSALADSLNGNGGNDTLSGLAGNDTLSGGAGNDTLNGGTNNDSLDGGASNDTLNGAAASDTLTGGAGTDYFVLANAASATNIDTITDFVSGTDVIELSKAVFTAYSATPNNTPVGLSANLSYDSTSGALSYDSDGAGATAAIQIAVLGTHPATLGNDFLIIA